MPPRPRTPASAPKPRPRKAPAPGPVPAPPTNKGGRPRKAGEVADRLLSVRLTASDGALLDGLVAKQQQALRDAGAMPEAAARVLPSDVVRGLIRAAAREAGLVAEGGA